MRLFLRSVISIYGFCLLSIAQERPIPKNVLYYQPIFTIINITHFENPMISAAYERQIGTRGISLFVPFHVGYLSNNTDRFLGLGSGIGIRKYTQDPFHGVYLNFQSDYVHSWARPEMVFVNGQYITEPGPKQDYLSETQLSVGYKWMWPTFTLDISGGGGLFATPDLKFTHIMGSVIFGLPINMESLGL